MKHQDGLMVITKDCRLSQAGLGKSMLASIVIIQTG